MQSVTQPLACPFSMQEALSRVDSKGNLSAIIAVEEADFNESHTILEMHRVYSSKVVEEGYLYPMDVLIKDAHWRDGKILIEVKGFYTTEEL